MPLNLAGADSREDVQSANDQIGINFFFKEMSDVMQTKKDAISFLDFVIQSFLINLQSFTRYLRLTLVFM